MGKGWKRALAVVAVALAGAFAAAPSAVAEHDGHGDRDDPEHRRLSGELAGKQFVAGPSVYLDAQVDGDVFAAGGEIRARGLRAVDLFAAGGLIETSALEGADAVLAGGSVEVGGRLSGDLIAAAGSLSVAPGSEIAGDALLAGGRVAMEGTVRGGLRAAGGNVRIDGLVEGPVELAAGQVTLGPRADLRGDLTYRGGEEIEILDGAKVAGRIERVGPHGPDFEMPGLLGLIFAGVLTWLGALVALVVLAAALLAALPRLMVEASRAVYLHPLPTFGLGVLLAIALPVGAAVAMATVVGIPVGLMVLALYAVLLAAGLVTAALWLGGRVPRLGEGLDAHVGYGHRLARAALGLLILAVVGLVPFVGGLALMVAVALGLGGVARQAWTLLGGEPAQG